MTIALVALGFALAVSSSEDHVGRGPSPISLLRERIFAHLALKPGMVVADIGIGGGWFLIRLAEAVGPNGLVYGTDIDPEAIATVQREVQDLKPTASRVDLRLCRHGRDTALDDLPDNHLDLVLMVDSLCFDAKEQEPRAQNVAYLRRFLRVLRPGGRLVHHMDCQCDASLDALAAQLTDAGFSPRFESIDAAPHHTSDDASWPCRSEAERKRHWLIAVFRKPQ